jgi:DNA-directed RNA polymerase subunit RPC12/RpoP
LPKIIREDELYVVYGGHKRRAKNYICPECGKIFIRPMAHVKIAEPYCSRKCFNNSQKQRIDLVCDCCGKQFERKRSKIKTISGLHFCSEKCRTEAQRIKNGILKPSHYKNGESIHYRKRAFELYGKECSNCGYNEYEEGLEAHHIDGDRKNNDDKNLLVLCGTCHNFVERKVFVIINRKLILNNKR